MTCPYCGSDTGGTSSCDRCGQLHAHRALSGWRPDPTARHEGRYYAAGRPTNRVRDGRAQGADAAGGRLLPDYVELPALRSSIRSSWIARQADQYEPSIGDAPHPPVREYGGHFGVGHHPLNGARRLTEAPTGIVDKRRTNERFIRETEPVRDYLVRNAVRFTRQRADAEDLVQETLLKAYVSFDSYREGTHLIAWLSKIMSNTWIDKHRSSQRRPVEQLTAEVTEARLGFDASHNRARWVASAESQALRSLPGDVESALQGLPDELRAIVYYACIADYRNTEIAALLDIPVGTVGSRLHRGKALLREALAAPGGDRHCTIP